MLRLGLRPQRAPRISRDANTGVRQDFTGLAAVVQLRLRVAFGLQTLTVKSRLLTGENTVRIRGNPPSFALSQRLGWIRVKDALHSLWAKEGWLRATDGRPSSKKDA
jgi:hypothetical protein